MVKMNDSISDQDLFSMVFSVLVLFFMSTSAFGNRPEVTFEQKQIQVGETRLEVEIADTPERTSQGLMHRKELAEGNGMLFIFPDEGIRSFWMKNTFVPLSIAFFNSGRTLVDMQDMAPAKSLMATDLPSYKSSAPAQYALEVPQGWFKKAGIKVGDKLVLSPTDSSSSKK